jgi:plasmid stabilization system protein ParE
MSRQIVFTDDGIDTLLSIKNFIENKWGVKQAEKFLEKTYKTLALAAEYPFMFKAFRLGDSTRVGLISKQTSFVYEVQETKITVLFFFDNRQEPFLPIKPYYNGLINHPFLHYAARHIGKLGKSKPLFGFSYCFHSRRFAIGHPS